MDEQLYRVRLGQVDQAAVLDGIDAKEIIVVGGTDEAFEFREDIRCPASCRSERAEALAQELSLTGDGTLISCTLHDGLTIFSPDNGFTYIFYKPFPR